MSVIQGNAFSDDEVDTGDIGHSLRFRRSASCYLNKTPPAAGNRLVWTYSVWFKRGELGTDQLLLDAGVDGNNESAIWINTSNKLDIYNYVGASYGCRRVTTAVLRDPTSWNHLVVSSNGTTHFKIYLNGVELTAFDTNTGTNGTNWFFNSSSYTMYSGRRFNATNYFDGEKARECWVADSALDPSSFGYLNTEINEWVSKSQSQIKAVVDAGGTNSFMLDFDDATSLTTLGYDKSSKGNNWTLNNFSLTAGPTYDHMLDVPGNSYATANPLDKGNVTLSDGNLKVTNTTFSDWHRGSIAMSSGKWAWEVTATSSSSGSPYEIGVAKSNGVLTTDPLTQSAVYAYYGSSGNKYNGSSAAYGATYTAGDVIRVELDCDAGTLVFFKNGTSQGTAYTGLSGTFFAMTGCGSGGVTQVTNLNFGQAPLHASATYHSAAGGYFRDAPTTGFKALCQANLPANGTVIVSGTFTGNASADGPCVWMNGVPKTLSINGNAVTFGTHADKLATGFKVRTSSASYNTAGSNTWTATIDSDLQNIFKYNNAEGNP